MSKKRLFRNLFLIAGGFVLLLIILAEIFKEDIIKLAIDKGAKTFDVPLEVGEVDFSLLYRFPYATIEFNDLIMLSRGTNDSIRTRPDTVAAISKLYASVDLIQLMKGNILVKKIEIEDVKAKYLVDSLGRSNFDFLLKGGRAKTIENTKDTTKVQGVYTLDKLELMNIELEYVDDLLKTSALVHISELEMNGEVEPTGFKAATRGKLVVKELCYGDYNCNSLSDTKLNFSVTALNDTIGISDFVLNTGHAKISLHGTLVQKDSAQIDVKFSGSEIDVAENMSILPQKMIADLKLNKVLGKVGMEGTAQGYVTANTLPQVDMDFTLADGLVNYDTYPELKNIDLHAHFSNGYTATMESSVLNIKKFHAETDKSSIDLSAKIINPIKPQYDISGSASVDLSELQPFIPDSLVTDISGNLKASLATSGVMPDSITDDFTEYFLNRSQLNLSLKNVGLRMDSVPEIKGLGGVLAYRPKNIKLSAIRLQVPDYNVSITEGYLTSSFAGKISDYENMSLQIDSLLMATANSYISASGQIDGFKDVKYDLKSDVSVNLFEIYRMLPDSLANSMSGEVGANLASAGSFNMDSVADQAMSLLFENSQFKVRMNNVYLNMPDTLMNVKMLSGNIAYKNDSVWMNRVSGNYLGLDFSADSTTVSNVYTGAVLNNPKELRVHGNFEVGDLDYAWIEAFMIDTVPDLEEVTEAGIKAKQEEQPYVQKYTVKAKGRARAKSFKYEDILAENIDSKFLVDVEKSFYVAKDLTCNVFGGEAKLSVNYDMAQEDPSVKNEAERSFRDFMQFKSEVKNLDVSRMMFELETYIDQEDFKKENVQGTLSGAMDGEIVLVDYSPVYEKMLLKGNVKIENGALINVKPIMEIEEIKAIKLDGLDKLFFSTIESNLFLFKNKMYFPRTNIKTSSFDAMFFGMYSFGEDYTYHLKMYLNQLLSKKDKAALEKMAKENGFEEDEVRDGKRPIYVVSKFENGKYKAGLDNRPDRIRMDAKVNLQEQMVSFRFDPRLVKYSVEDKE
ncbi:AsmA family protein [Saccharicrinis sp. 156]|uniref:AsmA family protein n=1 Tax=Saccharicrinis sp. 156 TaxID=3417574 RepID=UPI003D35759B